MYRITEDPSSGSLVQCLDKNYKNYSIVSVDMDKVDVMASYNAPAHSSHLIQTFLAKNQTPVLQQAPYKPDMAPATSGCSANSRGH